MSPKHPTKTQFLTTQDVIRIVQLKELPACMGVIAQRIVADFRH